MDMSMDIRQESLESLQLLAEGVRTLFPDNVEFHRAAGARRNFFLDWPLQDQPQELTQKSRTVSLYFSDQFLERFATLSEARRESHIRELRRIVAERLAAGFDDGSNAYRYRVKEAFVIDLTRDLAI